MRGRLDRVGRCLGGSLLVLFATATLAVPTVALAQEGCPAAANDDANVGWTAYRDNLMTDAESSFGAALDTCGQHIGAQIGLAYVYLRMARDAESRNLFLKVLPDAPADTDVLTGLGLLAWRAGRLGEVAFRFETVMGIDPGNATALEYLARLPEGYGPPPERPPLVLPDTLVYPARVNGERIEIRGEDGWEPFYIKGVNLGAALPGKFPSEFPDSTTYARWISQIAEMGANTIRLYTIHPPHFYEALHQYNTTHPDAPLWLIAGVWTELPPDDDYLGEEWESSFFTEMERVVDLQHGRANIRPEPGHAAGFYTADVSPWVLAYIIGREWEPFSVVAFDSIRPGYRNFHGKYMEVSGGTAMDAWLGRAIEHLVAYETETYRAQRPSAYTNWPTLDPLYHPTETTRQEEVAIRESRGERVAVPPREYNNDEVGLDAMLARPTQAYPAGYFASFHAYPYYPDLMLLEPAYQEARSSFGPSTYFGYLQDLKQHHDGMPVVVSEYGVPTSLGSAHLQPNGMHHGGHTEASAAAANRRMTLELEESGMAGGALFSWIDEWFKKNWIVAEFELPADRNRLWRNRLDAEQHYGVYAMEAHPAVAGATLADRAVNWGRIVPLYQDGPRSVRAASDEDYLWFYVEEPGLGTGDYRLGFDIIDPASGDFRWPGRVGERLPVGVEFVLVVSGDEARLLVDPPQNPFRLDPVGQGVSDWEGKTFEVEDAPPGLFRIRAEQRFNVPYETVANEDGRYDSLRVMTNRRRFARDGTEYLGMGYDRGILRPGDGVDGLWSRRPEGGFEVRIPWMLLNVTDPSSRTVLQGAGENHPDTIIGPDGRLLLSYPDSVVGVLGTEVIESIGIVASGPGGSFPREGEAVARYSWDTWEVPAWRTRRRPTFDAMRDAFARIGGAAGVIVAPEEPRSVAETGEGDSGARPPQRTELARANAAWQDGDTSTAREFYLGLLDRNPGLGVALHRLALMIAWDEKYDESLALFDRLLAEQPDNFDARVDRARVLAWKGDMSQGLAALDDVLRDDPTNVAALSAAAQFQAWSGQHEESLAMYDRVLAISPNDATIRRARAQTLVWASRFDAARESYQRILADAPDDVDARLGLAQMLTFADQLDAALTEYDRVLAADARNAEALRGKARALSWGGRLVAGEEAWRLAARTHPGDVGALIGLGKTLRWQGRNAAALEVLERAERADPTNEDAKEQLRWVYVALGTRGAPTVVVESDSDDNLMVTTSMMGSWYPQPRLKLRVDGYLRTAEQGVLERTAQGLTVTASYLLEPGWTVFGTLGGSDNDSGREGNFTHVALGGNSPGRYPFGGSITLNHAALDATAALIERGIVVDQVAVDGRWIPAPGWRANASLGLATFKGVESNRRWNISASASRRVRPQWTAGVSMRTFGFQENLNEGYFDPDRYWIGELIAGWSWEPGRWSVSTEFAPGVQQVGTEGDVRGTLRANSRVVYRVKPGREISIGAGYSSTGLQSFSTGDSSYRYTALILSASWVLDRRAGARR